MITVKIKDSCRRPYLSSDRNHFRTCITRPLGEHPRQVSKRSDQWCRGRYNNEIVTVLSKGQIVILNMAAVWPYLLTYRCHFWADTSRHCEKFICKVSANSSSGFGGDAITVKIKDGHRRPFVNG